ncbi:MAG: MarR family winged helix-turn-helix transcriptional regulator [Candidatus Thorarchaeota archaeon]
MDHEREELLYDFVESLRRLSRMKSFFASEDLSLEEFMVLDLILESDGCSMKDIVNGLTIAASTATGVVDRLVSRGLVERHHSERDRRKVIIELTRTGRQAHERFRSEALASVEDSVRHLSDDDIRSLIRIMKKVIEHSSNGRK